MSREIDHFFLWRQDQKFDETVAEPKKESDKYMRLYEDAKEEIATLRREIKTMPEGTPIRLIHEFRDLRNQLGIRSELLTDFLEYCENVGLIKNVVKRKIIDNYLSSRDLRECRDYYPL